MHAFSVRSNLDKYIRSRMVIKTIILLSIFVISMELITGDSIDAIFRMINSVMSFIDLFEKRFPEFYEFLLWIGSGILMGWCLIYLYKKMVSELDGKIIS
jgi:hypothetical protein